MNSPNGSDAGQRTQPPPSDAAKTSQVQTQNLFRTFIVVVLGSFFVYQLAIDYLWLSAILTAAAIVLGVLVLVRAAKLKESRLVLIGAISGLVVAAVQVLLVASSAVFFNQVRDYQQCARQALTQQAASQCRTQLQNSMPMQLR
ncbi:MAG: hypothetical protein JWM13_550 [Arthrobacter sp.]|jgi:hypothetical protein|nr:hypothetical protein [Arthrobacter sp.]